MRFVHFFFLLRMNMRCPLFTLSKIMVEERKHISGVDALAFFVIPAENNKHGGSL